jgi:histidyl-tRNA synthetase
MAASLDALDALGLTGASVRINDRRVLDAMLATFGFAESERPGVLITIDKLDKLGVDGVVAELRERGATAAAVDAFEAFLRRPQSEAAGFDADGIRRSLPDGIAEEVIAHLVGIGDAVRAARGGSAEVPLVFDPFLVRGMGYYTGTIFELAHPSVSYSLGGGGRYDGMIGRFLGSEVPAVGFSLGFERLVDLLSDAAGDERPGVVLVHDRDVSLVELLAAKSHLVAAGSRVRVEQRPKNLKALLERAASDGYGAFVTLRTGDDVRSAELRPIG